MSNEQASEIVTRLRPADGWQRDVDTTHSLKLAATAMLAVQTLNIRQAYLHDDDLPLDLFGDDDDIDDTGDPFEQDGESE